MMIQGGWDDKTAANKPMEMPSATGFEQSVQVPNALEIVLSSPDTIQVNAAGETDFHLAIDATDALPPRSIVAVSGLPHGASFSEGRPYGTSGWSLRPDEIGDLQLRLPGTPNSASTLHIELLAADGAVLAQSETRLMIATALAEPETWMTLQGNPFDQIAASSFVKPTRPMPSRKPISTNLRWTYGPSKLWRSNLQSPDALTMALMRWVRRRRPQPSGWRSSEQSICTHARSNRRRR